MATAEITVKHPSEVATYTCVFAEMAQIAVYGKDARQLITEAINALDRPPAASSPHTSR
ncbi:hypothetical protein AB8O64_28575 [Streptomyces sp. QH1-20]|uniref:hypothetical protein n=1 Tax=Streptomyces sp. QH1-20 TaxID=3240934 RepID=UPI003514E261